ncbi:MAG: DUF3841 domain-containing protein [Peptostreptococcaceae bacterium]|nr:DUF3841 domain-containing protein [Peptostreptococcaceae bacterium]
MNDFLILYTAQKDIVMDTINKEGIYKVKREYIKTKYKDVSNIFLNAYDWFVNNTSSMIDNKDRTYPIWTYYDLKYIEKHHDHKILKLKVPKDKAITFDSKKWNKILNQSYIEINVSDLELFNSELKKYNLKHDSDAYMSNFYPLLKNKIQKSWLRLFDDEIILSDVKQAALFEIKKEWIIEIF